MAQVDSPDTQAAIDFFDIQAPTPDLEKVKATYAEIQNAFDTGADADARLKALERWDALRKEIDTWGALVGLHFQQDTKNAEYKAALEERDEMSPKLRELEVDLMKHVVASDHKAEVANHYGAHLLDIWECATASYDPAIEAETVAEAKTGAKYTELTAGASFEFEGETLNLSQLRKYSQHKDRKLRYGAQKMQWGWFEENKDQLDGLYDELVKLRVAQAEKLGYDSYIPLAYKKMGRTDYGPADVARYRDAVRDHVVPLCTKIRERQRQTLGLDTLMAWDHGVQDLEGAPRPKGDHDWMMERAIRMFDEMGDHLGGFFRRMADGHFLDLKAREGKGGGGFCTSFPSHGMPFIFANFNGTKGDVEVFTHEVGHAFQNYQSRNQPISDFFWPTSEGAEVHSMSLEYLTWPHMEKFFEDDAERFRKVHLTESLLFLPYGVAVDHFQHLVFENPSATPAERLEMWQEMRRTYLPHENWGDLKRPSEGGFWQAQLHIYRYPFYYIDYTLAGVCAMQFWAMAEKDRAKALEAYVRLCQRGGEKPFQQLVKTAGITSPFEEGCLTDVVAQASKTLGL